MVIGQNEYLFEIIIIFIKLEIDTFLTKICFFSILDLCEVAILREVYPNYYYKFSCIADKCRHSCCIGWEIDIDDDTLELYDTLNTPLGEKIRSNIEGEVPHFKLTKEERCPFLNENGLCDIILEYGDGAISDICYLHPRFTNFYSSFEETGLGLCCEEAARIILSEKERFSIEVPENVDLTNDEKEFFEKRQKVLAVLQDRTKSIKERFDYFGKFDFNINNLCQMYLSLERLDDAWTEEINKIKDYNFKGGIFNQEEVFFEQLAVYFVFRHLNPDLCEAEFNARIKFAIMSCCFIGAMCEKSGYDFEKMTDIARMYSSEIEYSDENLDLLYN